PPAIRMMPFTTWPIPRRITAAGNQTRPGPTAGSTENTAMSVPENRSRDAESPEEDRTDRTLNDTDDERPLDRGQRSLCDLGQELAFAHISERQHANQRCDELAAVAEEEEEDVQHEEEERG